MPYGLRGYSTGLGFTMWDLMAASKMENCDVRDPACMARNQERDVAVQDLWYNQYQKDPNTANLPTPSITLNLNSSAAEVQRYLNNQPLTDETISVSSGPQYSVAQLEQLPQLPFYVGPSQPGGPGTQYHPSLLFSTSRGGSSLYPGDTWSLRITGGRPQSTVMVMGGKGGSSDTARMGVSDANGSFNLDGQITDDQVGSWSEQWSVGGVPAGSFAFSVAPTPKVPATASKQEAVKNSDGSPALSPFVHLPDFSQGFSFSSLPWWAWAGAAGVAFLAFRGKG